MRVLHVTPAYYPALVYGGPILSVRALNCALAEQGWEVRVLTTDAAGLDATLDVDTRSDVLLDGMRVRYHHRVAHHSIAPSLLAALASEVRRADVVHLTAIYNFTSLPTLLATRALDKPLVWSPRGALQRWEGSTRPRLKLAYDKLSRWLVPRRTALHVTAHSELEESTARLPDLRAFLAPNGVEIPTLPADARPPDDHHAILFIGRLDVKKGIERLIEACALLDPKAFPYHVTLAGNGDNDYLRQLENLATAKGVREHVTFVGDVRDDAKTRLFCQSHFAVFPSHTENFGIVVAEALAHGVPVVASTGTPWAKVEDEQCGLWVDNDPRVIADAILSIATMDLEAMGSRGRTWMARDYSWNKIATEVGHIYRELISA